MHNTYLICHSCTQLVYINQPKAHATGKIYHYLYSSHYYRYMTGRKQQFILGEGVEQLKRDDDGVNPRDSLPGPNADNSNDVISHCS
jgi:hypothetical protein